MSQINCSSDVEPRGFLVVPKCHFASTRPFPTFIPHLKLRNIASSWLLLYFLRSFLLNSTAFIICLDILLHLEQRLGYIFLHGFVHNILNFLPKVELISDPIFHVLQVLRLRLVWRLKGLKSRRLACLVRSI
jgi:hypothetical protein